VPGHKFGEFTDPDQAPLAEDEGPVIDFFSHEIWPKTRDAEFLDRSSPCHYGSGKCVLTIAETAIEQQNFALAFVAGDSVANGARIARGGQAQGKALGYRFADVGQSRGLREIPNSPLAVVILQ
jgi:hypothetical protein